MTDFHLLDIPDGIPVGRVHIEGRPTFFEVVVYPTWGMLRKQEKLQSGVRGVCQSQRTFNTKTRRWGNRLGRLAFCAKDLSTRIVAHEVTHACLQYMVWKDIEFEPLEGSANERFCYMVGDTTSALYYWFGEKGLLEPR